MFVGPSGWVQFGSSGVVVVRTMFAVEGWGGGSLAAAAAALQT